MAAARAALSPAENFGPRSGQLREGSNGFHLGAHGSNSGTTFSHEALTKSCGNDMSMRHGRSLQNPKLAVPHYFV